MTSLLLAGIATTANAAPATLTLGVTDVITLPANDGVRDTTPVTISSNVATTVTFSVRNGDTQVKQVGSIALAAGVPGQFIVPVSGLPAGALTLVAKPSEGAEVTTALTVGSGQPSSVQLTLSKSTIYTWKKATPRSTTASVLAFDETGLAVPFTGTVTATVGGKTYKPTVKSTTGNVAKASISVTKLAAGTGSVKASVRALKSGSTSYASNKVTLKVLKTAVSSLKISKSESTVFPAKDSYKDSVKITLTPKTTTGKSFASTGKIKIVRNGKTVKSWTLKSSAKKSVTWNGKVGTKIVPGTYTIIAELKGPEGSKKTVKTSVKIDKRKLTKTSKTVTHKAKSIFGTPSVYDFSSYCSHWIGGTKDGQVECTSGAAESSETYALYFPGAISVPSAAKSAQKWASVSSSYVPKATVSAVVVGKTGSGEWGYWNATTTKQGPLKKGTYNNGALKLPKGTSTIDFAVALYQYSSFKIKAFKVKYTYYVLK